MPKRKLEEDLEGEFQEKKVEEKVSVKKNSLDSDESESEGDEKAYQILAEDDIEGQEEGTAQFDGDTKITPFNMKEELEEGHFDADGHYHFKKDADEIKDHWLDNIDWVKVKKGETVKEKTLGDDSSSDEEETFDHISAYKKILLHLKPGESVAKALRRLGGTGSLSASQRLKMKKQGQSLMDTGDKEAMLLLTELANGLLNATGNMDVYQETYEQISRTIKKAETKAPKSEELDMYADDFDLKEKARLAEGDVKAETEVTEGEEASTSQAEAGVTEVQWEFKWTEESSEIHGPHTSQQMLDWVKDGYFKDSVCVRKVGTESSFYSCRRVDFDLYV